MRLRWTSTAANDLENISEYLHHQNPQFAQRTVRRLYAGVRELAVFRHEAVSAVNQAPAK